MNGMREGGIRRWSRRRGRRPIGGTAVPTSEATGKKLMK